MKTKLMHVLTVTLLFALCATLSWSQATAGKVQGKITSGGKPVPNVQITLTNTTNGRTYKMKADKDGTFSAVGVMFGEYDQEIESPSGEKIFKRKTSVTGGKQANGAVDDLSVDIGEGGGPKISKEEMEKLKADREKAMSENTLINQLNPALQAKNWEAAEPILRQLVTMNPNRWEYQQALGNAQLNLGKFEEALATYEKAIPLAENAAKDPKADPAKAKAGVASMLTNEGSAYGKLKQPQKAVEAYTKAAEMDPNPGTAYFNLCATQYNSGNTQGALAACEKAIAADPNRADAYYIKGSLMMAESKKGKDDKLEAPAGTADAFNKYLELAPDGPHAND
ncbi:MAG TPA: tetratricopeptide repeat protein, partial [Candidatus Sulfotelmatobacter sp.]|nr:tetratricopeptide repeat protein [Candidatus Sulfotelmatobacter sp.]